MNVYTYIHTCFIGDVSNVSRLDLMFLIEPNLFHTPKKKKSKQVLSARKDKSNDLEMFEKFLLKSRNLTLPNKIFIHLVPF